MKLKVECYAGWKADERPLRFELDGGGYAVEEVLDQWYGPESTFFKVRAERRQPLYPSPRCAGRGGRVVSRILPVASALGASD